MACSVGGKGLVNVKPGDRIVIETPGSVGYGEREDVGEHKDPCNEAMSVYACRKRDCCEESCSCGSGMTERD